MKGSGTLYRLSRPWGLPATVYVALRPGDGGKDWGYTSDPTKAQPLPDYWRKRFLADCRAVGVKGTALECHGGGK